MRPQAIVAGLGVAAIAVLPFVLSPPDSSGPPSPASAAAGPAGTPAATPAFPSVEGTLTRVSGSAFVLRRSDTSARDRTTLFRVRSENRLGLDVPHLRDHVRTRQPVRVFYKREGDVDYAIVTVDSGPIPKD